MIFADLKAGESIFLDANTLIYHFGPHPTLGSACTRLMQRIENQELIGYIATNMLTEVAHRLMILEAAGLNGWPYARAKQRLQQQPAIFRTLTQFRAAIATVLKSKLQVFTIQPTLLDGAAAVSQTNGLLSNDALVVALMQSHGITNLASSDVDFDRVPGLTRYAPF